MVYDVEVYSSRKWLRVILFREFSHYDAFFVWDNIFAYYLNSGFTSIELIDYIAVAMIIHLKSYLS